MIANYLKAGLICLCALGMYNNSVAQTSGTPIKNIVLVHGAWADGSGWRGVYDILVKDGYNVSIVQEPETSFKDDVAATKPAGKPRKKARRNIGALPRHLPRCEQVLEPDTTACPCCQGVLHRIGEDVSEVLDVIPAILRVLRTIRPKYGCRA